jgi:hypothetical protein
MSEPAFNPSSFLATKGVMAEATFRAFQCWNLDAPLADNVAQIRKSNPIGGPSAGWLKDFGKILLRRFGPNGPDRFLVELVKQGWDLETWRPVLLWHASSTDPLLTNFFTNWLFELREQGIVLVDTLAAVDFLRTYLKQHIGQEKTWSESNLKQSASGLLRTGVEFHLLRGRANKQFEAYRLPELSFFYFLHVLKDKYGSTDRMLHASDWRLFLLRTSDIEEELLRLHQFRKLRFERAGSMMELTLPHRTLNEYLRSTTT